MSRETRIRLAILLIAALVYVWPGVYDLTVPVLRAASAVVQSCYSSASSTTTSCTTAGSVTAANALVMLCQSNSETAASLAASDNNSNTYTEALESVSASRPSISLNYDISVTGGAAVQGTCTAGTSDFIGITLIELSGVAAFDVASTASNGASGAASTNSLSLTATGIVIAFFGVQGSGTITPNGSWTQIQEDEAWTNVAGGSAYIQGAAGSYAHTWGANPSAPWKAAALAFTDTGGGGGGAGPPSGLTLLGIGTP